MLQVKHTNEYIALKVIWLIAMAATIAVVAVLWYSSLLPASLSGDQTTDIIDKLPGNLEQDYGEALALLAVSTNNDAQGYTGDKLQIGVTLNGKSSAIDKYSFKSDNTDVAQINAKGMITLLKDGRATIRVTDKTNALMTKTVAVTSLGNFTQDVEGIFFESLPTTADSGQAITVCYRVVPDTTRKYLPYFASDNKNIAYFSKDGSKLYFVGSGTVTVSVSLGGNLVDSRAITVARPVLQAPPPQAITCNYSDIRLILNQSIKLNCTVIPSDSTQTVKYTCSNTAVVKLAGQTVTAVGFGSATVTVTSSVESQVTTTINITVAEVMPQGLNVISSSVVSIGQILRLDAVFDNEPTNGDVRWTIVSGANKLYTKDNGELVAKYLGKVVIKATSVVDPSISGEITINIRLYNNFVSFVRKILMHFVGFALLGVGLLFTCWIGLGRRWYSLPIALGIGAIVAAVSELFQLPIFTAGRFASFIDVGIDILGVITGIIIAIAIVTIVLLLWRIIAPASYRRLLSASYNIKLIDKQQRHRR